MAENIHPNKVKPSRRNRWETTKLVVAVSIVVLVAFGVLFGSTCPPDCGGNRGFRSSALMSCHAMGVALYSYATDHDGHYPGGNSSTDVFQQLMDQEYITDPSIFFIERLQVPGKTLAHGGGSKLKPENVCWDVTGSVDNASSGSVPLIFLSGFTVTYGAGASAKPKANNGDLDFLAVFFKDNSARVMMTDKDGSIPSFIPADFEAKGKVYKQLTP